MQLKRFDKAALALSRAMELDPKASSNMMEDSHSEDPLSDMEQQDMSNMSPETSNVFTPPH